ncbi:MAG: replication protein RepA [Terriglobia bacterium]|nr:replication protein RepA [Terriglobia bacterium]
MRAATPQLESPRVKASIIDRRIENYASQGLSRSAILEQLLTARWPLDQLRTRFPEMQEGAFAYPPAASATTANAATAPTIPAVSKALPSAPATNIGRAQLNAVSAASTSVDGISFQYVPLIQCSFPHADPKHASTFTRKNGWLELTLGTTRPEAGLPYGVPARLLTIYCTSEAVRANSPEIYLGDSVHDFLRRLDVPITRGARGSLSVYANQLLRLIHSTLSIDENIRDGAGRQGLHMRQALFVEEARLWWDDPENKNHKGAGRSIGNGSSLMLSSVLFHSILERSAPLATSAIKQLRKSPMDLDVYAWLVHRLFHLSKPSMVSWEQLSNQFGHNYGLPRKFRHFFLDSLKRVSAVYREAKLQISESGVLLLPSRPHLANSKQPKR